MKTAVKAKLESYGGKSELKSDFRKVIFNRHLTSSGFYIKEVPGAQDHPKTPDIVFTGESFHELAKHASFDPIAFDAALELSAKLLESADQTVPGPVKNWIIQYLRGEISRPKNAPGTPNRTFNWRNMAIAHSVFTLVENFDIKESRSIDSANMNACQLVSDVLSETYGINLRYETVLRIWKEHKKFLRSRYSV